MSSSKELLRRIFMYFFKNLTHNGLKVNHFSLIAETKKKIENNPELLKNEEFVRKLNKKIARNLDGKVFTLKDFLGAQLTELR
jgi:hypothetical protein